MACKNIDHSYKCNCDVDGKEEPIRIADDNITAYNGLFASMPEDDIAMEEFNSIISQHGLDKVCEMFPYVKMKLNRYGVYVPIDGNQSSKISNLYHILKAKRRDEANEAAAAAKPNPFSSLLKSMQPKPAQQPQVQAPTQQVAQPVNRTQAQPIQAQPVQRERTLRPSERRRKNWFRGYAPENYKQPVREEQPQQQIVEPPSQQQLNNDPMYIRFLQEKAVYEQQQMMQQQTQQVGGYVSANQDQQMMGYVPAYPQQPQMNGYVPASEETYPETQPTRRISREEQQFEEAVKNVRVIGGFIPDKDEERTISFKASSFLGEKHEEKKYSHNYKDTGSLEPKGGVDAYNPEWHPNDPKNYPQQPTQSMFPTTPASNGIPQPAYYQAGTPGMVNENVPGKETFFSLNKMVRDKANQNSNWQPNHLTIKTPEFPDGIDESHPEFKRVHAGMMHFDCFDGEYEYMSAGYVSKAKVTGGDGWIDPAELLCPTDDEVTDKELEDALIEKQFGERIRNNNMDNTPPAQPAKSKTGQVRMSPEKMQALFGNNFKTNPMPVPPSIPSPQPTAFIPPNQLYHQQPYYNNGMTMPPNGIPQMMMGPLGPVGMSMPNGSRRMSAEWQARYGDNEWMLPTQEELDSGKCTMAYIVKGEPEESIIEKKRESLDDIKVAVVKAHKDENGVEWEEFLYGDEEAVNKKKDKKSISYQEAYVLAKKVEAENDTYALAKELSRYNTHLADDLLWHQQNADLDLFHQVKSEARDALLRYRGEDNLSAIKSTVFVAGDRTIVQPGKPTSMGELERIAMNELLKYKSQKEKNEAKEEEIIENYRRNSRSNPVTMQIEEIRSGKSLSTIVKRLQTFTDMRIICTPKEEKMNRELQQRISATLNPMQINERDNYFTWKKLTKLARKTTGADMSNFDREFDEWWGKPRIITPAQKAKDIEDYRLMMTEAKIDYYNTLVPSPPEGTINVEYQRELQKAFHDFDKGTITPDLSMSEFFKKMGYLSSRKIEMDIQRQSNVISRLFDPAAYATECKKHCDLRRQEYEAEGYTPPAHMCDPVAYAKKRQAFINQIFKKADRGTIA